MDEKVDILIVDDLPEKVLVYRAILDELEENLVVARSGEEALAEVLRREFAVILLDVCMPGMDGLETAALIRKRKKSSHTPIIFVTAFADELRSAQGYAHGAVDYILAPVIPEVLRAKVKVFVDLYRMTRQVKRQAEERVALAEERSRREAAEDANRRLAFLARAGAVLGQSLDYDRTAADAARLPVPDLADLSAVVFADTAGGPRPILARAVDGAAVLDEAADLPPHLADAVGRAFAGGVAQTDSLGVVLPLVAGGRTVAVLALARSDPGRPFTPADVAVADALASRAASALDNARLYREIQRADRQKNEFLSMLAHELRNPLAPIRNAVTVLRSAADPAAINWANGVIDRQVRHLVRLVDDLLDVSRITRGKIRLRLEPVDVAAIVAQAVEASRPIIDARRHQLDVRVSEQPMWVHGDSTRLAQVLTNLLNNAAKYTEPGGNVWLTAEPVMGECESGRVRAPVATQGDSGALALARAHGPTAIIRVRDSGIGIPPDLLATVFDPFTQGDNSLDRSEGGLGIGLTLVRRLVDLHGGTVTAASAGPGRGSEFTVRLPLIEAGAGRTTAGGNGVVRPGGWPPAVGRPMRVLVVDDNVDGADSLGQLLKLDGHEVRLAHDGPAALATAVEFRPEAVVLDIGLPDIDGFEVARRIRGLPNLEDILLVAVTGYGRQEDRLRSAEAGFDHHMVKPVDLGELRSVIAAPRPRATAESNKCG